MKKRAPERHKKNEDKELKEALAVLISSTRSKRRPLPLTDIARWLGIAVAKLGSYPAVSERVGISAKMLRQFAVVDELADPVKELFAKRDLDSVDAAVHLSMLSGQDQEIVGKALCKKDIRTADVRAVVQLRQLETNAPIGALLQRVIDSKTKQEYVAEFVIRGGRSRDDLMKAFVAYIAPEEIIRLEIQGALGRLVLTEAGKQYLLEAASTLQTSLSGVIPAIIEKSFVRS
jgi:hypothetical protein